MKTNDSQDIIFTTLGNENNVAINSLYVYEPVSIPNTETQIMFNESMKNINTITYDSWYTERKLSTHGNELQVKICSAQKVNSPNNLIAAFQTLDRVSAHNKTSNIATFDHVNVKKYFAEVDGYRYPRDAVITNFPENDFSDQYGDLKVFYLEYVGEELMNPFIFYTDMKNKYPIQVIYLRHHVDSISPKKIQLSEKNNTDPVYVDAKLFGILIRHRQFETISDGNIVIVVKVL